MNRVDELDDYCYRTVQLSTSHRHLYLYLCCCWVAGLVEKIKKSMSEISAPPNVGGRSDSPPAAVPKGGASLQDSGLSKKQKFKEFMLSLNLPLAGPKLEQEMLQIMGVQSPETWRMATGRLLEEVLGEEAATDIPIDTFDGDEVVWTAAISGYLKEIDSDPTVDNHSSNSSVCSSY